MADEPPTIGGSQWSPETLVAGSRCISQQPSGLLVKTEEDQALLLEYQVA